MPWRYIFFGLILASLPFASACAPEGDEVEMSGQVFLVLPDGDSQPLSLVTVRLFERPAMVGFMEEREEAIQARMDQLADREAERREKRDAAIAARDEAEVRYRERREEVALQTESLERETRRRLAEHRDTIRRNEAFMVDLAETPQPPEGIPTREEFEAFRERRELWFSMNRSEREAWQEALASQIENLREMIETIQEEQTRRLRGWEEELAAMRADVEELRTAVSAAEEALAVSVAAREEFPSVFDFFQELPDFADKLRTDANGEFAVNLPAGERKALLAMVDREIRGEREQHCWLIWIDPSRHDGRKLLLSNHNALTWDSRTDASAPWGEL